MAGPLPRVLFMPCTSSAWANHASQVFLYVGRYHRAWQGMQYKRASAGVPVAPQHAPPPPRPLTRVVKGNAAQSTHATQWGHPVKIIIKAATRQRVGAMPPTHRCTLRRQQVVHTRWHVCPCFTAFQHAATNLGTMHCRIPLPSWRPCTKYRLHLQRPTLTAQPAQHC